MCLVDHNRAIYRPFVNELPDNRSHHVVYDRTMIDIRADCYLWSSILIYNWSPIDIFPYNRALVNIRMNCHLWPPIHIWAYNVQGIWPGFLRIMEML